MTKEKEEVKERWRDKKVRIVDAVLVGTLVGIGVSTFILSQANVTIHFSSHQKHGL